nr:Chain D, 9-residue synthetic peptide from SNARE protein Bet1 [synthetic construct]
GYSACEEEN